MKETLSILAALIAIAAYAPYARDIYKDKVKPARSARIMFVLLLTVTLLQQNQLHSGWLLAITLGDWAGCVAILLLALKRGVGGLSKVDLACYGLLIVGVMVWQATGNALLALHLSVVTDVIAFTPTLLKTWHQPWTETPLFFVLGGAAPFINIIGAGKYSYGILLFPVYLGLINLLEAVLIIARQARVPKPHFTFQQDHQPIN